MQQTVITEPLPTLAQLFKALGIALIIAAVILITVVLPAEYDIDPTGIGKALGLTALNAENADESSTPLPATALPTEMPAVIESPATTVTKSDVPFRSEQLSIQLQPGKGVELKAKMRKGDQFVFSWQTDGTKVFVDMHGEKPNDGDKFISYWEEKQSDSANGAFIAPFDGSHGWYWRNTKTTPVTITIQVSGFYEKLYKP